MKKIWMIPVLIVAVFGVLFIGCDGDNTGGNVNKIDNGGKDNKNDADDNDKTDVEDEKDDDDDDKSGQPPQTLPNRPGYVLDWYDEFDYTGEPDPAKWDYEIGLVRNNELQSYQKANASVANGVLLIEGRKLPAADQNPAGRGNYTSASLITKGKKHFKFGIIQVRAKLPFDAGVWPAIWTLGANTKWWPVQGEVDILELYRLGAGAKRSDPLYIHANWAWKSASGDSWTAQWNQKYIRVRDWASARGTTEDAWFSEFHVWELFWDETTMSISIDGVTINTLTEGSGIANAKTGYVQNDPNPWVDQPFLNDQYLILNLAIGGDQGGTPDAQNVWPMRYEIDYVRYYKKQ